MNRFLALYFHFPGDNERRREFTHIYAKDLSEAIAKWSGICSANEQLVHIVPNPTPDDSLCFACGGILFCCYCLRLRSIDQ